MAKKRLGKKCWKYDSHICLVSVILLSLLEQCEAIACYTCSSWNGSDPDCHDPYNPHVNQYKLECMVPKQGHVGQFPAQFCIKLTGRKDKTGESLMIRACAIETMDNQCGMFRFGNQSFKGCILTCDYNGCNTGFQLRFNYFLALAVILPTIKIIFSL